jgi:uncharacterized protein (TIGR02996 family)
MIERIEETLRDDPDDWSAWLAYAGRLVEQGDPELIPALRYRQEEEDS